MTDAEKEVLRSRLDALDARARQVAWRDEVPTPVLVVFNVALYGGLTWAMWSFYHNWMALIPLGFVVFLAALVYGVWRD